MTMETLCREHDLLTVSKDNVMRVPFLIKGNLRVPPEVLTERIHEAFSAKEEETGRPPLGVTAVRLQDAQVLREPVVDRETMTYTDEFVYQVLPVFDPEELLERDTDRLVRELYNMPFDEVLTFLGKLQHSLSSCAGLLDELLGVLRRTAPIADLFLNLTFSGLPFLLNPESARAMIERELSCFGVRGSQLLDTWVKVAENARLGLSQELSPSAGKETSGDYKHPGDMYLRAMPTRQLHLTAGNAPAIPIISTLRAITLKSAAVIKSPYGATLGGALVSLAAVSSAPNHPSTRNLSIVYWPGGDESVEGTLFRQGAFDRIVIWGAPDAVASVRSRALFTKLVTLNPRYGMSWIGKEAFENDDVEETARRGALDSMIWNQKACISSLVHYVEGDEEQAAAYARALQKELAAWDGAAPNFLDPMSQGRLQRLRRGKFVTSQWMINKQPGGISSSVVVVPGEFDLMDHPMNRMVVVRPVSSLEEVIPLLSHNVSTVGVFPEARRQELCDRVLATGVSTCYPLGMCDRMSSGAAHDGMKVLSELVDWKNK